MMFKLFTKSKQKVSKLDELKGDFAKLDKQQLRAVLGGVGRVPVTNIISKPDSDYSKPVK